MTTIKYLLISTLTASLVILAGCTQIQTTNTNTVDNTNTNSEVVVDTNKVISNENINTTNIDTSDWNVFIFDQLGFSMLLPLNKDEIEMHYNECGVDVVCSSEGYSYVAIVTRDENYIILNSVSKVWTPKRSGFITEIYDFEFGNNEIIIDPQTNGTWSATPLEAVKLESGRNAYIFDPIEDYYSKSELYNVDDIEPAYAAVIPLQEVSNFKATMMYVEKADISLEEMQYALSSIQFN